MNAPAVNRPAPVVATWVCLVLAWVLFLLPIPGLGLFGGGILNLVAFILAIVVMAKGRTVGGLVPLLASIIVSPIIYFIGLAIFGAAVSSSSYKDYTDRAQAAQQAAAAGNEAAEHAGAAQAAPEQKPAAIAVTATKLVDDYEANEVSADNLYKGKRLAVTGKVGGINKDFTDSVYVELETTKPFQMNVHAGDVAPDVAAGLTKGATITVECEGAGMVLGTPMLNECEVK